MFTSLCFLAALLFFAGLGLGMELRPATRWRERLTVVLLRSGKRRSRIVLVRSESGDWDAVEKQLVGLFADGKLRLAELQQADKARWHLEARSHD